MDPQYSIGTKCMLTKWVKFLSFTQASEFEPTLSLSQHTVLLKAPLQNRLTWASHSPCTAPLTKDPPAFAFYRQGLKLLPQ